MLKVSRCAIAVVFRFTFAVAFPDFRVFLRQIERVGKAARSENSERLLSDRVDAFERSRCIDVTPQLVEVA